MRSHHVLFLIVGLTLVAANASAVLSAQGAPAKVFTAAQADEGKAEYQTSCAACHGADLGGGEGPQLAGEYFQTSWKSQTTGDLFTYVQGMPPGGPALSDDRYVKIVAFLLKENGAQAGDQALAADTKVSIASLLPAK